MMLANNNNKSPVPSPEPETTTYRKKSRSKAFSQIPLSEDENNIVNIFDTEFFNAISCGQGHFDVVERLLDDDPNRVNAQDNKGWTCLHHAAARGRLKIIDLLLSRNADIDAKDQDGNTALHVACEKGKVEAVSHLLINGADGNLLNNKSQAPIHVATIQNKPKIIDELMKFPKQVDVNQKGWQGASAIHDASVLDYPDCADALLRGGSKLCQRFLPDFVGCKKRFHSYTGRESYGYTREKLLSFVDNEHNAPLHSAVNSGDYTAVKICLDHGARIDTKQDDQATAFHLACSQGTCAIVRLMYESHIKQSPEYGAEVLFVKDVLDMTPLHKAAMFDHPEVVKYLIDMGSELDALDIERRSPLLLSAVRGGTNSLNVLLSSGASVSVKDSSKRNVLHFMVAYGGSLGGELKNICEKEDGIKLLNQKDVSGCTPMHLASKQGNLRLLESLLSLGAMVNLKDNEDQSPLHFAARYGRINTVRRLLRSEHGPNIINECDGGGMTALHLASMNGHTKVVQQLLYKGALLHKDFNGRTPLHLASEAGYTQTMRLLLSFHRNLLDQKDKKGSTALHYAAYASKAASLDLLMSAGASYDDNADKRSPMDICIEQRFVECATVLVEHERWDEVLHRCSSLYTCPLLGLIRYLPEVHVIVLDRCRIGAKIDPASKDYWEKYRFEHLQAPISQLKEFRKQNKELVPLLALNHMVKYGRVDLLSHPVSLTYLRMKWRAYGFYFYSFNLCFYLFYLAALTCLTASLNPTLHSCWSPDGYNDTNGSMSTPFNSTEADFVGWHEWRCYILIFISGFLVVNFIKEFMQIYQQRCSYFQDFVNYSEWGQYICTGVLVVPLLMSPGPNDCVTDLQWQFGAVAIFLAWFNLLLYLSRTQSMGIYIVMFLQILKTVVRVIVVFSVLFIAFGLTFHILLFNNTYRESYTSSMSVIHSVLMMMGDWDFVGTYARPYIANKLLFPFLNFFFLILFIVLMPILFINLLIGLAVGDIEIVLKHAQLKRLAMQVEYHTALEERLPAWLLSRVDQSSVTVYPNRVFEGGSTRVQALTKQFKHMFGMHESPSPEAQETTKVVTESQDTTGNDAVMHELCKTKRRMKEIQSQLDKQNELLRLIVQKMEISAEADEYDEGVVRGQTFTMDAQGALSPTEDTRGGAARPLASRMRARIKPVLAFARGPKKGENL